MTRTAASLRILLDPIFSFPIWRLSVLVYIVFFFLISFPTIFCFICFSSDFCYSFFLLRLYFSVFSLWVPSVLFLLPFISLTFSFLLFTTLLLNFVTFLFFHLLHCLSLIFLHTSLYVKLYPSSPIHIVISSFFSLLFLPSISVFLTLFSLSQSHSPFLPSHPRDYIL